MKRITKDSRLRIVRARHTGDMIIDAKGTDALSQESVPVIGGWKDYTGSGGVSTKALMFFNQPDELWGTDAWIDGARKKELDVLGNRKRLTRLRRKKTYLKFD